MSEPDPDLALRQAAITRAIDLREAYDDLVPRAVLLEGFAFRASASASVPFNAAFTGRRRCAVRRRCH
jgi:hypothetical protein